MALKLSILIATMPSRKHDLNNLLFDLRPQCEPYIDLVEIIMDTRIDINIGQKRNALLEKSIGYYVVYIDDDDHISPNYVESILLATETNPDCIGISGWITTNGNKRKDWHISKDFKRWHEKNNIYYRTPNHISPVLRELALAAGFPEWKHGEDAEYSKRLLPMLKTEVKIKGYLYHYDFKTLK